MTVSKIIELIEVKHKDTGIHVHTPATIDEISTFQQRIGFNLPRDFIEFYTTCNGFGCNEDIFNIIQLAGITRYPKDYGTNWFYFSEYMIYSDMWGLRLTPDGRYEIFNGSYSELAMTSSIEEFLSIFLKGNVFDKGGLYDWHDKLKLERS